MADDAGDGDCYACANFYNLKGALIMLEGKYISFKLGEEEFALPILNVQEIINPVKTTKLPDMPPNTIGVVNLRGKVISVIDLRKKLSIASENGNSQNKKRVIVINMGRLTCGGLVDSVTGAVEVKKEHLKEAELVSKVDCVQAIATLDDDRVLQLLDAASLMPATDESVLDEDVVGEDIDEDGKVVVSKRIAGRGGGLIVKEIQDRIEDKAAETGEDFEHIKDIVEEIQVLLDALSAGDFKKVEEIIDRMSVLGEHDLFSEVGKVTRNLHNAIKDFKSIIDPRLKNMALEDMPDASDKLSWVITKTEEAAGKTISLMEKNISLQSDLIRKLDILDDPSKKLKKGSKEYKESLKFLRSSLEDMNSDFMDVLIAQEYQDITGQIIKKVIDLVGEVEGQLVELVKVFGVKIEPEKKAKCLAGPQIKEGKGILTSQEDVDSLLSEFGF